MATLSQNINQAISDFDSIKDAIEAKGVTIPSGTPTSDYDSLIANIPTGDDSAIKSLISRTGTTFEIPSGTTKIGNYAFYYAPFHTVSIPNTVTKIGGYAFYSSSVQNITIPNSVTEIDRYSFEYSGLTSITIPAAVTAIRYSAFDRCSDLTSATILMTSGTFDNAFIRCSNLSSVSLANGFDCSGLELSSSTLFTAAMIVSWLNALKDNTGETAKTLTIGATNLAKLSSTEIAIATNKNWNLA